MVEPYNDISYKPNKKIVIPPETFSSVVDTSLRLWGLDTDNLPSKTGSKDRMDSLIEIDPSWRADYYIVPDLAKVSRTGVNGTSEIWYLCYVREINISSHTNYLSHFDESLPIKPGEYNESLRFVREDQLDGIKESL